LGFTTNGQLGIARFSLYSFQILSNYFNYRQFRIKNGSLFEKHKLGVKTQPVLILKILYSSKKMRRSVEALSYGLCWFYFTFLSSTEV